MDRLSASRLVKWCGAVLLIVSLALPLSKCTHYQDSGAEGGTTTAQAEVAWVDYQWALESFDPVNAGDWLTIFAFVWPILALAVLRRRERGAAAMIVRALEPLLIAGSAWWLYVSAHVVAEPAIGAYVAFAGLSVYTVGAACVDLVVFGRWRRRRERGLARSPAPA
jgi:hypothetical protein